MFRFLHLADVHLDTKFKNRSAHLRDFLLSSQRRAFETAVDCALRQAVDSVLIAGDFFDNEKLSFATQIFLGDQLQRLEEAGIPCVYVTGNHDPGFQSQLQGWEWPKNFNILHKGHPEQISICNREGRRIANVIGAGHGRKAVEQNLAAEFPSAESGVPNVGLLHTLVTSAEAAGQHDRYAPCSVEDLRRKNYAYWALGHVHLRQKIVGEVEAWYAGVIQGRNFTEPGLKGGLLVTLPDSGRPTVEFQSFAQCQFESLSLGSGSTPDSIPGLKTVLEEELQRAHDGSSLPLRDWLVQVNLNGASELASPLSDRRQREELEEELTQALQVKHLELRTEGMRLPADVDRFRGQRHILGEVLNLIEKARENREILRSLRPEILAGKRTADSGDEEYLLRLLENLEEEAVLRFQGESDAV